MPLYDPAYTRQVIDPADAVQIVHEFLDHCRHWAASREVPKYLDRVAANGDPRDAASLHAWMAYLRFIEQTQRELESGELDHWFLPPE